MADSFLNAHGLELFKDNCDVTYMKKNLTTCYVTNGSQAKPYWRVFQYNANSSYADGEVMCLVGSACAGGGRVNQVRV